MSRLILFIVFILLTSISYPVFSQANLKSSQEFQQGRDSSNFIHKTEKQMPFKKGRVLLGTSVYLSSGSAKYDTISYGRNRVTNDYNFEFKAGYFVIDKFMVGLSFRTKRTSSTEYINRENEVLQFGPYLRYYPGANSNGGVYLQLDINYVKVRDEINFDIGNKQLDKTVNINGIGSGLGVGYSYSPFDRITLDMGIAYTLFYGNARSTNNLINKSTQEDVIFGEFVFGFGVNILL
jgi:hypothetical protein